MLKDLLIPFITVGIAELGDKTQLSILLLSSQIKNRFLLLLGIIFAFFIVDGAAILLGSILTNIILCKNIIKILTGTLFVILGIFILLEKKENEEKNKLYANNAFLSGFLLIFLTEWFDKTQITAGIFAIKYNPLMVLIGTMLALILLSTMAVWLGKLVAHKIDKILMKKIVGILFIIIGIFIFWK